MKPMRYKGMDAVAERVVMKGEEVIEIWIIGPLTTARALTSALLNNNHRKRESGIYLDGEQIHLTLGHHYTVGDVQTVRTPGIGISTRAILMWNQATSKADPRESIYLTLPDIPEQAPPEFYDRLFGAIKEPMMPEWADWLWTDGLQIPTDHKGRKIWHRAPVKLIEGHNLNAYEVTTQGEVWRYVIRKHLGLLHQIKYNKALGRRWDSGPAEERKRYASRDPRFPGWHNVIGTSPRVAWYLGEELMGKSDINDTALAMRDAADKAGIGCEIVPTDKDELI